MKIALTGHTRGFGKYMFDELSKTHEVIGFSKSTGYNICKKEDRTKIIELSSECDVFINCAHDGFAQTEMLYQMYYEWKQKRKLIINLGSNAKDFTNRNEPYSYSVQKIALNHASKQLGRIGPCKVTTVDFGFLIRDQGSTIGYEDAFEYIQLALSSATKKHRLLEILVAHD